MFSEKFCPNCLCLPCCEHFKNNKVGHCEIERDYYRLKRLKYHSNNPNIILLFHPEGGYTELLKDFNPDLDDYNIEVRKYLYENEEFILRFDNSN